MSKKDAKSRKAARLAGGFSPQEAAKVMGLQEAWAQADERRRAEEAEQRKNYIIGLARNVGELSAGVALCQQTFVESVGPLLTPRHVRRMRSLPGSSIIFARNEAITQVCLQQSIPRAQAVSFFLSGLPSANNPIVTEVTGIWPPAPPRGTPPDELVPFDDIYLKFNDPTMRSEAAKLKTSGFWPSILLTNTGRNKEVTAQQLGLIVAATQEIFVGQSFTFGPMEPFFDLSSANQTGP